MTVNNGQTEEAIIIRSKLQAEGYELYGLPEMKKHEQALLLHYLQSNKFDEQEMKGISKLFECRLYKRDEEKVII